MRSLRSAPEQNAFLPAPVMMITLTSLLNCNSSIYCFSSRSKAKLKEFITSVRLRVRVTIWFFFSLRRMLSFIIASVNGIIERALAQFYCLQLIILFCQEKILVKTYSY